MGHRVYKNVHLLIPYTGKVLLGKDFLREYYIAELVLRTSSVHPPDLW